MSAKNSKTTDTHSKHTQNTHLGRGDGTKLLKLLAQLVVLTLVSQILDV